jgi:hypothetical protein
MSEPNAIAANEPILDAMIQLALAARSHRVIAAGSTAVDIYRGLCRRGFSRVSTTATCSVGCAQHDVALVAGEHTIQALEAVLLRIVPFLNSQAMIAVWIDSVGPQRGKRIQLLLERLGFRIECGTKCESGFVLAARRHERNYLVNAA